MQVTVTCTYCGSDYYSLDHNTLAVPFGCIKALDLRIKALELSGPKKLVDQPSGEVAPSATPSRRAVEAEDRSVAAQFESAGPDQQLRNSLGRILEHRINCIDDDWHPLTKDCLESLGAYGTVDEIREVQS